MTKNVPNDTTVIIKAYTSQTALWHPSTHNLTTLYRTQYLEITGNSSNCNYGFDLSGDCSSTYPQLGKNKYRITIENANKEASIVVDANGCNFVGGDLHLTYDWNLDQFFSGGMCGSGNYGTEPINYFLSYDNKNCLELYLIVSSYNGHPYLSWNPYHTSISGYYVHKKLTTESGTITTQHFTTSTNWTDNDFTIGNPKFTNDEVEYYITAKLSPTQQSLASNHVVKYGTSWIQWKISNQNIDDELTYTLNKNYPNPFNPSTEINYSIADDGFVKIQVFNLLGENIKTLVNEYEFQGNYSVKFISDNLPSGVYIYRMQVNNKIFINKMLLLR